MKAFISFKPVHGYQPQFSTPVLHPAVTTDRYQPDLGWLHCLRGDYITTNQVKPVELEGGWDAERFSFVLQADNTQRTSFMLRSFLFGYTEPCTELTDETKLYFTRLNEIGSQLCQSKEGPTTYSRNQRDLMIFSVPKRELGGPIENTFNAKVSGVFNRLGCERAFSSHIRASDSHPITNLTSVLRPGNYHAAPISSITAEGWCAEAVVALLQASNQYAGDLNRLDTDETEILQHASDMCQDTILEMRPVWEELSRNTNIGFDGYITFGELKALMEEPTAFSVSHPVPSQPASTNATDEAKSIFDFFVKQAVAEAHHNGYGSYYKTWARRGDSVAETIHGADRLVLGTVWTDDRIPEEEPFGNQKPISLPVDSLPRFYGVENWTVTIKYTADDDIVGTVCIGTDLDHDTSVFVRPAFSLAMTSGLILAEGEMNDLTRCVEQLINHTINEPVNLQPPY